MHGAVGPASIVIGVDGVVMLGGLSHARRADRAFQRRDLSSLGMVLCALVTGVPLDEIADAPLDALIDVAPDLSELIRQLLLGSQSARAPRGLLFE